MRVIGKKITLAQEQEVHIYHDGRKDAGAVQATREGVPPVLRAQVVRLCRACARLCICADAGVCWVVLLVLMLI